MLDAAFDLCPDMVSTGCCSLITPSCGVVLGVCAHPVSPEEKPTLRGRVRGGGAHVLSQTTEESSGLSI